MGRVAKPPEAVQALTRAKEDPVWMVRDEAALALWRINSHRSTQVERSTENQTTQEPFSNQKAVDQIHYQGKSFPCYPGNAFYQA